MSANFSVFYVKNSPELDHALVNREELGHVLESPVGTYALAYRRHYPFPKLQHRVIRSLSVCGDTLCVGVAESAQVFHYEHFIDNELVRRLCFAQDAGWSEVLGTPEAWEEKVLWTREQREKDLGSAGSTEEIRAEIAAIHQGASLQDCDRWPQINSLKTFQALAQALGLQR